MAEMGNTTEEKTEDASKKQVEAEKHPENAEIENPKKDSKEIALKVHMHCEGCARKIRRSLERFEGVDDVFTDWKSHKVVVKGQNPDPSKVLERVQRKNNHRKVEFFSPITNSSPEIPTKIEEPNKTPISEDQNREAITVVIKVNMHCPTCAFEIKKRIMRMRGVKSADADLKISEVSVKGIFDPTKLVEHVYKRTGKHAVIVKTFIDGEGKDGEKEKYSAGEKKDADIKFSTTADREAEEVEVNKSEYYYSSEPTTYMAAIPMYAPPQIFSEENPNACTVM